MTSPATPPAAQSSVPAEPKPHAPIGLGTSAPAAGGGASLPAWCPAWAERLGDAYLAGTSCVFLMHGNVRDLVPIAPPAAAGGPADPAAWGTVSDFLAREMFGRWDIVLAFDVGKGLRPLAGPDPNRLRTMAQCSPSGSATRPRGPVIRIRRWPRSTRSWSET
ncbi:MAG: hypothetical protein ACKO4Z_05695 [Planctomycetota bacterium]